MKKITAIVLASTLLYWASKSGLSMTTIDHLPNAAIKEGVFVNIIRDLELLNSWLENNSCSQETIDILRHQNHQKILALYGVDPRAFQESIKYYLEDSLERALKVYEKVYIALEALST